MDHTKCIPLSSGLVQYRMFICISSWTQIKWNFSVITSVSLVRMFWNWITEKWIMGKQDLSRFVFKMDFRWISYIAQMWAGPLIFLGPPLGISEQYHFSILGLCAVCWAHFMCHHKLWPTSVSHPFSSVNSSLGLTGGKYYQNITLPLFRLILQNCAFRGCFLSCSFLSLSFLLSFSRLVCYCSMWLYFTREIS